MNVFVVYDGTGRIRATLVAPGMEAAAGIKVGEGLHTMSLKVKEMSSAQQRAHLHDLHKNHRVKLDGKLPGVVRNQKAG